MPRTDCLSTAAAEDLYKQLLRQERAAWDALFVRPFASHQLSFWRRSTAQANAARKAFLGSSSLRGDMAPPDEPALDAASATQALRDAIQRQKLAWIALEHSMRSGLGKDPQLLADWVGALHSVRAARKLVAAQRRMGRKASSRREGRVRRVQA